MLSCCIDAQEKRDVATVDIPGAFMQAEIDETVHVKLEGTMAELMVRLDPKLYRQYVQNENGKPVLYVELNKALYGTLRAALLFWKKLSNQLQEWGFTINPYDWCVANKTVHGKQCTVLWHVDDLKISHEDPDVVTSLIGHLEQTFGQEAPLTITRGNVHDYLGMTIDYSVPGKVKISMDDYVRNLLEEVPEDMNGIASSPAAEHLFKINTTNPIKLSEEQAVLFHHYTAKLLFLSKRARPDIQTAVAFLSTRVKAPDVDDYKKLARVIKYLRGTATMPLTLEAHEAHVMKWWVDAAHAVHEDLKGHTGGAFTMGQGTIYGTSTKQKLVTRSSTEAELVGLYDIMPQIIWTRYFLQAQGYEVRDATVYQDNKSAMLLEENGRGSSSKRTRHINIRYFFITDRIRAKEINVQYCSTNDMLSDYFTKPLQGTRFRKLRNQIMNIDPNDAQRWDHRSVLEPEQKVNGTDGQTTDVRPDGNTGDVSEKQTQTNG
jgi:hypothetical protein